MEETDTKWMDDEAYTALAEAVYFCTRICGGRPVAGAVTVKAAAALDLHESVFRAMARILVACGLMACDGGGFMLTEAHAARQKGILDAVRRADAFEAFFAKAADEKHFFFDGISDLEYEIYARCNFPVTYAAGQAIASQIDLAGQNVLELGGSSGGLGAALTARFGGCAYTVVDTKIPCAVGRELNEGNRRLRFTEDDLFTLKRLKGKRDCIILMNVLHDFDDEKCLRILRNATRYGHNKTVFVVVEDMLTEEFAPREVLIHGLRLAVECRGGRQRTAQELAKMFSAVGYRMDRFVRLNAVHSMCVYKGC